MTRRNLLIAAAIFALTAGTAQASTPELYLDGPEVNNLRLTLAGTSEVPTVWYVRLGYSVTINALDGLLFSRDGSLLISLAFGSQQTAQNFTELGYVSLSAASDVTNTLTFGDAPIFEPRGDVMLIQRASLSNNVHFRGVVGTEPASILVQFTKVTD